MKMFPWNSVSAKLILFSSLYSPSHNLSLIKMVFVCVFIPQKKKTELFSDLLKVSLEIETAEAVQNIFRLTPSSHFNVALLTLCRGLRQNLVVLVTSLPVRYHTGTSHHLKVNDGHQRCAPLSGKSWKQPFDGCVSHIPFHIPYVFVKSISSAKYWLVGGTKEQKKVWVCNQAQISASKQYIIFIIGLKLMNNLKRPESLSAIT